jgi:acyl-CoA synthetase (NDP forming)
MASLCCKAHALVIHLTSGISTFSYPDSAARTFTYMWRYTYNLRELYETPTLSQRSEMESASRNQVEEIIQHVRRQGRTLLTEIESKRLLALTASPRLRRVWRSAKMRPPGWLRKSASQSC